MDFIETVKSAGIVGAGGAGFPTHVKLNAKAEYFIINAAECEPLIETDKFICRKYADEMIDAVVQTAAHLQAQKIVIAIKAIYKAEIESLQAAIKRAGAKIEICGMPAFYPAGDEQTMVQFVTGRSVPERGLPLQVGAVVDNVGTMLNLHYAMKGQPVCDKFLSVVGEVKETTMLRVPLGTSVVECINQAGPLLGWGEYAIIMGGPMMGKVVVGDDIKNTVVTKTTGNIIVLPKDHYLISRALKPIEGIRHMAKSSCIQCRFCTDMCPRYQTGHKILPHLVMRNFWRENSITDDEEFVRCFGSALNCCDCGVCEMFACPMNLSPRKANGYFKIKLRERGLDMPKNQEPHALPTINHKRIATSRLVARLGLNKYYGRHAHDEFIDYTPKSVFVPFSQHIGKPAQPVVKAGDKVEKGQLIAAAAEGALSTNIHTGFAGVVKSVDAKGAVISSEGRK